MTNRAIPLVDLSRFIEGNDQERSNFVQQLGDAFHQVGFVGVKNHGISQHLVDQFYREAKQFFSLPIANKRRYEISGLAGQRGYTSFGKEHAKHSKVPDLKEFYQIGQSVETIGVDHPDFPNNVYVKEFPQFTLVGDQLFKEFEKAGTFLLRAIASYLKIGSHYFDEKITKGNSILRAIHYPPITQPPASAIRAEQHEDINLITLLVGASAGGLEVLTNDGNWLPVIPEQGEIVVNVGDMLQRLTNDYLRSTTHRVVNPPRELWHLPRLSIPFFLHPIVEMELSCLKSCIDENNPPKYVPISAGAYLHERLIEIGLKK